jgi:anti-sigma regulatory factor (Ser/Thr protein kinase)/serine/threonine protein phosphatase PrpC
MNNNGTNISDPKAIPIIDNADVIMARRTIRELAVSIGFDNRATEELVLSVSELANNVIKYAERGIIKLIPITDTNRPGIRIECSDRGPGIIDVDQALADGFSTSGSLGYGLGSVERFMDELNIGSNGERGEGLNIGCIKWLRPREYLNTPCPLDLGVAVRPLPTMKVSGDTFVISKWNGSILTGVIDGLGHGKFAHRASQKARHYIENHFDLDLETLFRNVHRSCLTTHGVVMALAKFDYEQPPIKLSFASIGNIEARIITKGAPLRLMCRRGILGKHITRPLISNHIWQKGSILVMHSDGISSHWKWEDFIHLAGKSATSMAHSFLRTLAKDNDDAAVMVVKEKEDHK